MVQRLATAILGVGFLAAFFVFPYRRWLLAALLLTLIGGILGVWSADHHIWIQNLPAEEVPACGPSFEYLMDTLPLSDLLNIMLKGNGNCAEISWQFLGLSMPEWTRLWFIGFSLFVVFSLFNTFQRAKK